MIDFVKGEKVRLSPYGIQVLIVKMPRQRILKCTSVGVVGSPSYCGGCVKVKFDGEAAFSDYSVEFIVGAES